MIWTAAVGGEVCGGCQMPFRADEPLALLTAKKLKRCQHCAGAPVDQAAVDAVIHTREADRAKDTVNAGIAFKGGAPVLQGFAQATEAASDGLNQLLKHEAGILGVRRSPKLPPVKSPLPFAEVAGSLPYSSESD
jgi:hypothetical protein